MKKLATVKTILIALAAILVVLCFIPSVRITGAGGIGDGVKISILSMIKGLKVMGEDAFEGNFMFIFYILIPVGIGASWIYKNKSLALVSMVLAIVNIRDWITYAAMLKSMVGSYGQIKIGIIFIIDIVLSLVVAGLSFLVYTGKLDENESDMRKVASTVKEHAASVNPMDFSSGGNICPNCGAPMKANAKFCIACGTKIETPKEEEKPKTKVCAACGKALDEDEMFCPYCGEKYKMPQTRTCKDCGAKLKEGADFCSRCGAKYEE